MRIYFHIDFQAIISMCILKKKQKKKTPETSKLASGIQDLSWNTKQPLAALDP